MNKNRSRDYGLLTENGIKGVLQQKSMSQKMAALKELLDGRAVEYRETVVEEESRLATLSMSSYVGDGYHSYTIHHIMVVSDRTVSVVGRKSASTEIHGFMDASPFFNLRIENGSVKFDQR